MSTNESETADLKYSLVILIKPFYPSKRPVDQNELKTFCRYQILGIFLLIQLCILGAERLRRSNLSSIASSINQISSGSYPSSTGVFSCVELLKNSCVLRWTIKFTCSQGYKYLTANLCFFVFDNGETGRGIPVLNEDGNIISDIRSGKSADVASHSEVFAFFR